MRDPYEEYRRWLERKEQEIADEQDERLLRRLRALPATDEEIAEFREAQLQSGLAEGLPMAVARAKGDAILRQCLEFDLLLPHLDVRDDADEKTE